jgi:hypothetical protein
MSYRFRVQPDLPGPPPPPPEAVASAQFEALPADAPIQDRLDFLHKPISQERKQSILQEAVDRHQELAAAIRSKDRNTAEAAMDAVARLHTIRPDVLQALRDAGTDLANDLRRFNDMPPEEAGYSDLGRRVRYGFDYWNRAWWAAHNATGVDGRPPLEELLKLAEVHPDNVFTDDLRANARAHLAALKPAQ